MSSTPNLGLHVYDDAELASAFSTVREWRKNVDGNNQAGEESNIQIIDQAFGQLSSEVAGKQKQLLVFQNVVANNFVSDNTYINYPYKCEITCTGITADSVVEVIFGMTEATSGNYAPICATSTNTVTIYAKIDAAITIPTIKEV